VPLLALSLVCPPSATPAQRVDLTKLRLDLSVLRRDTETSNDGEEEEEDEEEEGACPPYEASTRSARLQAMRTLAACAGAVSDEADHPMDVSDGETDASARPVGYAPGDASQRGAFGSERSTQRDEEGDTIRSETSSAADAVACKGLLCEAMGVAQMSKPHVAHMAVSKEKDARSEADELLELRQLLGRAPRQPQSFSNHAGVQSLM